MRVLNKKIMCKKNIVLLLLLLSVVNAFSKKNKTPKGMVVCTGGFFEKVSNDSTYTELKMVKGFFISNEITNKEFRKFYDYLKEHNEKFLTHINTQPFKDDANKENYFFNPRFNDYPVVGISKTAANMYCIWKTEQENKNLKKNKKKINKYRLPTEIEWVYLFERSKVKIGTECSELVPSKEGVLSKLGPYNLNNNVSEFTSSIQIQNGQEVCVIRGGSFCSPSVKQRLISNEQTAKDIGFRIARNF